MSWRIYGVSIEAEGDDGGVEWSMSDGKVHFGVAAGADVAGFALIE
jgi:hypothetical protein